MTQILQTRQRRWLYPNINIRIIMPFLLLVVVIAGLGSFITTRLVASSIQERFTNQLADSAQTAISTFTNLEKQELETLRLMAFTVGVSDAISQNNAPALQSLLVPVAGNKIFEQIIAFDRQGQAIVQISASSVATPIDAKSITVWPIVKNVLSGQADKVGDKFSAIMDLPTGPMFVISTPVTDSNNGVIGGIVAGISLRTAVIRLSEQSLANIIIYDTNNKVLSTTFPVAPATLTLSPETFARVNKALPNASPLEDMSVDSRSYQALYLPLTLRQSTMGMLAVALPSNFIVERSSTSRDILGVLFAVLFVMVILLGLIVARTITSPVAKLVATTRAIRSGDLSQRVQLRIPDELGELGTSFDAMTDQLVKRNVQVNKLYQDQLLETARRDAVFSSISEAIFVLDSQGSVILRNSRADNLVQQISAKTRGSFRNFFRQIGNEIGTRTVEVDDQTFLVNIMPVSMMQGNLNGQVVSFQDITALLENERIKDDLIKQISHELRTPLTAIRGYVELVSMLESQNLGDQSREFISSALDNLTTMGRMVSEVIDVSVIVSNSFELEYRHFDLGHLLGERFDYWSPIMQHRNLRLVREFPDDLIIDGDENRLSQTLDHLLLNAYSYSLPGGTVTLGAWCDDQQTNIFLQDEGVGIDADEIEKVFERMYRGRAADAGDTDARGLGLGLYLSRRIIEAHRGTITLQSKIGQGTVVKIALPWQQ